MLRNCHGNVIFTVSRNLTLSVLVCPVFLQPSLWFLLAWNAATINIYKSIQNYTYLHCDNLTVYLPASLRPILPLQVTGYSRLIQRSTGLNSLVAIGTCLEFLECEIL